MKVLIVHCNNMFESPVAVGVSSLIGSIIKNHDIELFDTTFYAIEEYPAELNRIKSKQVKKVDYEYYGWTINHNSIFTDFRKKISEFQPEVILFSVVECSYSIANLLINSIVDLKQKNKFKIAIGGIFAQLMPDFIFQDNTNIDAICISEGENVVKSWLADINQTNIEGFWFRKNGEIIKNKLPQLVDLNKTNYLNFLLYENRRLFKPMSGKFWRMLPIEISRGCPYSCAYCCNHALEKHFNHYYRLKSIERIHDELVTYRHFYHPEAFYFVSESFTSVSLKRFDEFCEMYQDIKIPFWFNTRPEDIDYYKAKKLKRIGCFRIGVGLEHGNEEFRKKVLNRNVSNERILKGCRAIEDAGIDYSANNIIGFPGETKELIQDTIELNKQINPETHGVFIFTPFNGTWLYDYCVKNGYLIGNEIGGDLNRGSILMNNEISKEELEKIYFSFQEYLR